MKSPYSDPDMITQMSKDWTSLTGRPSKQIADKPEVKNEKTEEEKPEKETEQS